MVAVAFLMSKKGNPYHRKEVESLNRYFLQDRVLPPPTKFISSDKFYQEVVYLDQLCYYLIYNTTRADCRLVREQIMLQLQ